MKKLFVVVIFLLSLFGIYNFVVPKREVQNGEKDSGSTKLIDRIKGDSKDTVEPEEIKIGRIVRETIGESLKFEGLVAPEEMYNVHTEVPIVIKEVLVKEGDQIQKGDKLLTFEDSYRVEVLRQLKSIKLDIDNAQLELRNMSSGSLQLELDNKKLETEEVRKSLTGLNRKKSVIQFELKNLREEAAVKEDLLRQDGISSIEANRARTAAYNKELEYEDIRREIEIARKRHDLLLLGYNRLEKELYFKESTLKSRISKLKLDREQKRVELSKLKTELKAPVAGIITELLAENGGISEPKTKLMSITPFEKLVIKINLPIDSARGINIGALCKVSMKDDERKTYDGRVTKISNIAKESYAGRMVEAEISIDNYEKLTPGELVNVNLFSTNKSGALTVNSFSVFQQNGKDYIYAVEDGIVVKKEIEVGVKTLSKYEVLNLEEGTYVVMYPFKVEEGQIVEVE